MDVFLPIRPSAASPVRCWIDVVDEPRLRSDRGADPERPVLPADERLEVVMDDRLADRSQTGKATRMKEDRVPTQSLGQAGHRGLRAMKRSSDLTMRRAGGEARRDRNQVLRLFQVVRRRERLPRARLPAARTAESRNASRARAGSIGAVSVEPRLGAAMRLAIAPRTEGRMEPGRSHMLDGRLGPAHASR